MFLYKFLDAKQTRNGKICDNYTRNFKFCLENINIFLVNL
jgi:hypothetical protein